MKIKNTIEDLLIPIKYVDEKIARTYKKIGDYLESKGTERETVCTALSGACIGYIIGTHLIDPAMNKSSTEIFKAQPVKAALAYITAQAYSLALFHDLCLNLYSAANKVEDVSSTAVADKFIYLSKKIQKVARLPLLVAGGDFLYDYLSHITSNPDPMSSSSFFVGILFTALASSMYLKDNDPKLLEKQSMWKDALGLLKKGYRTTVDAIGGLIPQPPPVPVRVNQYKKESCQNEI